MSDSPLNYSSVDYDFVGLQVHASGEVWSATNFDIRPAMMKRYGDGNAAAAEVVRQRGDAGHLVPGQPALGAAGVRLVPAHGRQPGQHGRRARRHARRRHDPLRRGQPGSAVERVRQARSGRGRASSNGTADANPVPELHLAARQRGHRVGSGRSAATRMLVNGAQLFVGPLPGPGGAGGRHRRRHAADRHGQPGARHVRVRGPGPRPRPRPDRPGRRAGPDRSATCRSRCRRNLASAAAGATATGDGINLAKLIDDDEATNWASLGSAGRRQAGHRRPGRRRRSRSSRVQGERHAAAADHRPTRTRRRRAGSRRCASSGSGRARPRAARHLRRRRPTSARSTPAQPDAFPSVAPRPRAPELIIASFDIPRTKATHLRIEVLTNQCTGAPDYAGEQDNDPRANTDCTTASAQALNVRVAEFQAFLH